MQNRYIYKFFIWEYKKYCIDLEMAKCIGNPNTHVYGIEKIKNQRSGKIFLSEQLYLSLFKAI